MQKLAAYRLEHDIAYDSDARATEITQIVALLREWLKKKRADDPDAQWGTFTPERQGERGEFEWMRASHNDRSWKMLRLTEELDEGRRFETSISITDTGRSVIVYATLASGLSTSAVTPVPRGAKCPRPIRDILRMHDAWYHGVDKIRWRNRVESREGGRSFAEHIRHAARTLPLVVVSEDEGELVLPKLDEELERELAGLANVTVIDDDASWGITDILSKENSCFWGAVRLYWPRYSHNDHPLWKGWRLLDSGLTAAQFAGQLRTRIMHVSAISVARPVEIDEIRRVVQRARFQQLQEHVRDSSEYAQLADAYAKDNDRLLEENQALSDKVDELETELQNVVARREYQPTTGPTVEPDGPDKDTGPKKGEVRYYKKVFSTRNYDKMVQTNTCNHNSWQGAHNAPKAVKGLQRLLDSKDWKSLLHCGSCKNGGLWRVEW